MEAVELAVEARLLNENSHHGYFIRVTTSQAGFRFQSLAKPCFLPIYRLAIVSIVYLMAAVFSVERFLGNVVRRVK